MIRWGQITPIFPAKLTVDVYRLLQGVTKSKLDQGVPLSARSLHEQFVDTRSLIE